MKKTKSKKEIIEYFLNAMAGTATKHEFEKHMNLISKKVEVYGVPGFNTIGYDDWFNQCENEFKEKLIKQVHYERLKIINSTDSMIMFKTIEHIETIDNTKSATGLEIIITLELDNKPDGQWRVTQERILSNDELEHDKNHGLE